MTSINKHLLTINMDATYIIKQIFEILTETPHACIKCIKSKVYLSGFMQYFSQSSSPGSHLKLNVTFLNIVSKI